jgi:hypothetical protein
MSILGTPPKVGTKRLSPVISNNNLLNMDEDYVFPDIKQYDVVNENMKIFIMNFKNESMTEDIINNIFYNMQTYYNNAYKLIKSSKFCGNNYKKNNILIASMLYNIFNKSNEYKFDMNHIKNILKNTNINVTYITDILNNKYTTDEDYIPEYIESFSTFNNYFLNIDYLDSIKINNYFYNYKLTFSKCSKFNDATIDNLTKRHMITYQDNHYNDNKDFLN